MQGLLSPQADTLLFYGGGWNAGMRDCGTAGKTTGETRDDAAGNSRISPIVVFNIANYRHFELEVKIWFVLFVNKNY